MDPYGLSCKPSAHENKGNIVYRALTKHDAERIAAGKSIQGKAMDGTWIAAEHVANQPLSLNSAAAGGPWKNSPWISTTKNMDIAKAYDSGFGIVQVDLNKVNALQVQVWEHAPRTTGIDGLAYHRLIWAQEVTILQEIPYSAIKVI